MSLKATFSFESPCSSTFLGMRNPRAMWSFSTSVYP